MVRYVVDVRCGSEQFGAVIEIHANDKGAGLSGTVNRYTGKKFSSNLERWRSVGGAFLDAGQRERNLSYRVKRDCASGHRSARTETSGPAGFAAPII